MDKKGKKEKLAIVPKEKTGIITQKPYDLWIDIDDLFDRFRSNFDELFWGPMKSIMTAPDYRMPIMDVVDLDDKYEMHVEMPGIPKDDISIEVTPTNVEICADHEENKEDKDKNWLKRERSCMSYYRSFELPEEIKSDNVDAEFKDGILTIVLPKVEPKPKQKTNKVKIK